MNLLERFKAWATSWWYVPTIEARQAIMLRDLPRHRGTVTSLTFSGRGVTMDRQGAIVIVSCCAGGNAQQRGRPHDGKTDQIDFTKGKFIW